MTPVRFLLCAGVVLLAVARCSGVDLSSTCLVAHAETLYRDFTTGGCGQGCDAAFCTCIGGDFIVANATDAGVCIAGTTAPTCIMLQECLRTRIMCMNKYAATHDMTPAPETPAPTPEPAPPVITTPGPAAIGQCNLTSNSLKVGLVAAAAGLTYEGSALDDACKNLLCNDYLGLGAVYALCWASDLDVNAVCKADVSTPSRSPTATRTFSMARSPTISQPPTPTHSTSGPTPTTTTTPAHTVTASHGPSPSQTPIATRTATLPHTATPSPVGSGSIPHSTTHTTAATHTGTATTTRSVALPTTPTASLPHSRSTTPSVTSAGTWTATQPPTATPTGAGTSSGAATPSSTRPASTTVTATPSTTQAPSETHSLPATPTMTTAGTHTTTLGLSVSATPPGGTATGTHSNTATPMQSSTGAETPTVSAPDAKSRTESLSLPASSTVTSSITTTHTASTTEAVPPEEPPTVTLSATVRRTPTTSRAESTSRTVERSPSLSSAATLTPPPTRTMSIPSTASELESQSVSHTLNPTVTVELAATPTATITPPSMTPPHTPTMPETDSVPLAATPTESRSLVATETPLPTPIPPPPEPVPSSIAPPPPVSTTATAPSASESESDSETEPVPKATHTVSRTSTTTRYAGDGLGSRLGLGDDDLIAPAPNVDPDEYIAPVAASGLSLVFVLAAILLALAIRRCCCAGAAAWRKPTMKDVASGPDYPMDAAEESVASLGFSRMRNYSVRNDDAGLGLDTSGDDGAFSPTMSVMINVDRPGYWEDSVRQFGRSQVGTGPLTHLNQSTHLGLSESQTSPRARGQSTVHWEESVHAFRAAEQSLRHAPRSARQRSVTVGAASHIDVQLMPNMLETSAMQSRHRSTAVAARSSDRLPWEVSTRAAEHSTLELSGESDGWTQLPVPPAPGPPSHNATLSVRPPSTCRESQIELTFEADAPTDMDNPPPQISHTEAAFIPED